MNTDDILSKLQNEESNLNNFKYKEIKQLLEIYLIFCKKEHEIFKMIYSLHGCDSYEDIFRDYDYRYMEDKTSVVEIAINELDELDDNDKN
jgi:hypothetical protein